MTRNILKLLKKSTGAFLAAAIFFCSGALMHSRADDEAYAAFDTVTGETLSLINDSATSSGIKIDLKNREVYTGGMPFGVKLFADGLLIVGFDDVDCISGSASPAKDAGMLVNDIIIKANEKKITGASDFSEIIEKSNGKSVRISYIRNKSEYECEITPSLSESDGKYKTGMWLRDSTAGIGTVTFIVPESGVFAGLGHGICDNETGALVPLSRGITSGVIIGSIKKGTCGSPGELKGTFNGEKTGSLVSNTENGVFGVFTDNNFCKGKTIPLGRKGELQEGEAYILCTLDDNKIGKYSVNISEIHYNSTGNKNFIVTVTDKDLIKKTGGIVQGMSGSPIIQDGKLMGAVTHVLVNDPTKGYGIFAENMLATALTK